ncbi:MAG: acyltransferase [Bacteroidales bacterium]|nr:acyltransferase [Bacteroidales bacterium]
MFDDIRPYTDVEIPAAVRRITADPQFASICRYVFPDTPFSEVEDMMLRCRNIYEFQHVFMYPVMKFIEKSSTHGLSYSGFGNLDKKQGYLFVSNHRDIVLDAAFLQVLLDKEDMETAEISFGANLMISPMIVDLGKANKMYKVERPDTVSSPREFFYKSQYLSEYIRHVVTENNSSIWIAQRNGRTKDGKDATDSGIVRMFSMSGKGDPVADMAALHIAPMAISYEWEPCDMLKARELYAREVSGEYRKAPGEDLNSIITGISQQKGRIFISICKPVTSVDLAPFAGMRSNHLNQEVARMITERINKAYHLFPNNYIAADLLCGEERFRNEYSDSERDIFVRHIEAADNERMREILLGIYANPVFER